MGDGEETEAEEVGLDSVGGFPTWVTLFGDIGWLHDCCCKMGFKGLLSRVESTKDDVVILSRLFDLGTRETNQMTQDGWLRNWMLGALYG